MTEDAFLRWIIAEPDLDEPRLIFADWLNEEQQYERSEFIRVQIALANMRIGPAKLVSVKSVWLVGHEKYQSLCRRERELLIGHWQNWVPHIGGCMWQIDESSHILSSIIDDGANRRQASFRATFRRGFVHSITCSAEDCIAHLHAILAAQPVDTVNLEPAAAEATRIALARCWKGISFGTRGERSPIAAEEIFAGEFVQLDSNGRVRPAMRRRAD